MRSERANGRSGAPKDAFAAWRCKRSRSEVCFIHSSDPRSQVQLLVLDEAGSVESVKI